VSQIDKYCSVLLPDRYTPYQNVESDTRYSNRFILYEIEAKRDIYVVYVKIARLHCHAKTKTKINKQTNKQ